MYNYIKMSLVLILAFLIRLIALNQSLWLDEATTANVVRQFDLFGIIPKFSVNDFHPPLYYLFMDLWTNLFGYSEIILRLPSVIFSLLTGWMVYLIGKSLKNEELGFWAATLFLFNPLIVYYSQEARMYVLVTFLLTAAFYFFLTKKYLATNILFFLSFLTFYGSIFFFAAIYLYLIFKKKFEELFKLLPGFLIAFIIVSPLLYQQWLNSREALLTVQNWSLVLGKANIKNLLLIPIKFSIGRISFEPKILYWGISGLWTAFIFSFVLRPMLHRAGVMLQFLFLAPLALGFVASFFSPLLQYFRFLYLIPVLTFLIVPGANKNWQKYTVLTGFIIFSLIYLLLPSFHREDWKSLVRNLPAGRQVYMIPSSSDPLIYYNSQIEINDLKLIEKTNDKEVVVIPYTSDIHAVDYRKVLEKNGYKLEEIKSFRGLNFERWLKKAFYYSEKVPSPLD